MVPRHRSPTRAPCAYHRFKFGWGQRANFSTICRLNTKRMVANCLVNAGDGFKLAARNLSLLFCATISQPTKKRTSCGQNYVFVISVPRKIERTEQMLQTFDDTLGKTNTTANLCSECAFRLWMVLSLLKLKPSE